jgi:hypothetical protein
VPLWGAWAAWRRVARGVVAGVWWTPRLKLDPRLRDRGTLNNPGLSTGFFHRSGTA